MAECLKQPQQPGHKDLTVWLWTSFSNLKFDCEKITYLKFPIYSDFAPSIVTDMAFPDALASAAVDPTEEAMEDPNLGSRLPRLSL